MMDIFDMASAAVSIISDVETIELKVSNGTYTTAYGGHKTPNYDSYTVEAEIQSVTSGDLKQVSDISQEAVLRAVYVKGYVQGVNRNDGLGGDLMVFYGRTWKVVKVLENWGKSDWCKVLVSQQVT